MNKVYSSAYQPEVDGLRAVAVLSVIFFHLQMNTFSGGFVGVDIFFVISGYLITGLLVNKLADGSGSMDYPAFYIRRIRRLFPALFVVCIASFICAFLLFDPKNMARFSGAVIYTLGSASNFYFLFESGYFDADAYLKPLLHMWSLGIEEQFYLLWPFLLTLFWRTKKIFIASVTLLSFFLCLYFIPSNPEATFFMMPFRIYEFGLGASLIWINSIRLPRLCHELLSCLGLLAIAYSVVMFNEETIFPGINALVPCIGAVFLIYSKSHSVIGRILRTRVLVHLGLLSYSLYLVHWPLIVFYKMYKHSTPVPLSIGEALMLLGLTYILSLLLHKFVESRFRYASNRNGSSSFGLTCSLLTMLLAVVSATSWAQSGWAWRFPSIPENLRKQMVLPPEVYMDYAYNRIMEIDEPFSDSSNRKVLVVGDSQGGDFVNMLYENGYHEKVDLKSIVIGAKCQPLLSDDKSLEKHIPPKHQPGCAKQRKLFARSENIAGADVIILSANWRSWAVRLLPKTLTKLEQMTDAKILVLGPKNQGRSGQELIAEHKIRAGLEALSASYLDEDIDEENQTLERSSGKHEYLDILKIICPTPSYCRVLTDEDEVIFFDSSHVTPKGARFLGTLMEKEGLLDSVLGQ